MSEVKDPKEGTQLEGGEKLVVHKIEVGRTPAEKELTDEKVKAELEKQKLITDLDAANAKLKELEDAQATKTTEYETMVTERDQYKDELTAIALQKFETEKTELLENLKTSGLDTEKIKAIDEKLVGPNEFEQMKWTFSFLGDKLREGAEAAAAAATAEEERVKKVMKHFKLSEEDWAALSEEEKQAKIAELPVEGVAPASPEKGAKPTDPPQGSQIPLEAPKVGDKKEYATYREMVDDLYDKAAAGDKVAKRQLDQLWDKLPATIKELSPAFTIVECPRCKNGVLKGEKCPYCDWDPEDFVKRGGEI